MKVILVALMSIIGLEALAGTCSKTFFDETKRSLLPIVYSNESVLIAENADFNKTRKIFPEDSRPFPKISEVKNCLEAASSLLRTDNCSLLLDSANKNSNSIIEFKGENSSLDPKNFMNDYYPDIRYVPSKEEMLFYSTLKIKEADMLPNDFGSDFGYEDFFGKMPLLVKSCRDKDKIPVVTMKGISDETGYATVDVYKSGVVGCTIVAPVIDSKVNFKVPDSLKSCVHNSDSIIISVEQKSSDGLIVNKKVAGRKEDLTSDVENETPKLIASENSVEVVDSLLTSLDEGVAVDYLSSAVAKIGKLASVPKIQDIDRKILEVVAICDGRVRINNEKVGLSRDDFAIGIVEFIRSWEDESGEIISFQSSNQGYSKYLYQQFSINLELFPQLKSIFESYKAGDILNTDLRDWKGKGYAMCSMVYPAQNVPSFIFDFLKDGQIDDTSRIQDLGWEAIPKTLFSAEAWENIPIEIAVKMKVAEDEAKAAAEAAEKAYVEKLINPS